MRSYDYMPQEQAAKLYQQRVSPERSSIKGIVAEYKRAEKWFSGGQWSEEENSDAADYAAQFWHPGDHEIDDVGQN